MGWEAEVRGQVSRTITNKEWNLNSYFSIYYEGLGNSFSQFHFVQLQNEVTVLTLLDYIQN